MRVIFSGYGYPGLVAGLESLGHTVITSQELDWYPRCWGNLNHVQPMSPREYGSYLRGEVKRFNADVLILGKNADTNKRVDIAADPDFWHIPADDIKEIHGSGVITIYLSLDDPDYTPRWTQTRIHPHLDAVGTCADDTIDFYKRWCKDAVIWRFWPAWDQVRFRNPQQPTEEDRAVDFVLVGSPYERPNANFGIPRRDIVRAALEVGAKVRVYGPRGWLRESEGGDPDFESIYAGHASLERLPAIFAGANVSYSSWLWQARNYLTDRVPIIAGAGGFNLMESQIGLGGTFQDGVHCGYHAHRDLEDFKRKLTYWLEHEAERKACAASMQALVLAEHSYKQRASEIDRAISKARHIRAMRPNPSCCR